MSITRRAEIETDYTDGSSNGDNTGGKPGSGDDGKGEGEMCIRDRGWDIAAHPAKVENVQRSLFLDLSEDEQKVVEDVYKRQKLGITHNFIVVFKWYLKGIGVFQRVECDK